MIPGQEEYFMGQMSPLWRLLYKTRSFRRYGEAGAEAVPFCCRRLCSKEPAALPTEPGPFTVRNLKTCVDGI